MRDDQMFQLFEILEDVARQAKFVFAEGSTAPLNLSDEERWARLLSHFEIAPGNALTPAQVSHAARVSGYGDPRGVGALYKPDTAWLRSEGSMRVLDTAGKQWFDDEGHKFLGEYVPENL